MPGPPRIHPVSQRLSHQTILPSNISDRPGLLNHLANGRLLKLRRKPRTLASHYSSDLSAPFYLGPLSGISTAPHGHEIAAKGRVCGVGEEGRPKASEGLAWPIDRRVGSRPARWQGHAEAIPVRHELLWRRCRCR